MVFDLPSWLVTMIADFGVGKQMVEVLGGSIPVLCSGGGGAGYSDTVTPISVEGFTVCVFIATDGIVQDLIQMGTRRRSRKGFLLTGVVYKPTIPFYTMGGLTPPPQEWCPEGQNYGERNHRGLRPRKPRYYSKYLGV